MYRRDFLIAGLLFSIALIFRFTSRVQFQSASLEVESQGRLYRGTSDGKVLVSVDAGKSWQLHTDFGPIYVVRNMGTNLQGLVLARLRFNEHSFELALGQNGKTWRTI